ncbi:hypothetical protein CANCADRAFT_106915 [Tortispora caseinolytica NRRL Y-17796]|uniref:BZIP domain-containing protein n=1 Tax=Tortispora caseinolytica NRRL Y-17796 TaxID=767744 RepID=A0A1E4TFC9_9ASCO|nr:hypothetical protein CANCADRAFT_106915 [Tortispora caseinolytica NRRL Y-17796]
MSVNESFDSNLNLPNTFLQVELDEDEKLLASEAGKKLSPSERRRLRNKVSARHFRMRRRIYTQTLEEKIADRDQEILELKQEIARLRLENSQLRNSSLVAPADPAVPFALSSETGSQAKATHSPQIVNDLAPLLSHTLSGHSSSESHRLGGQELARTVSSEIPGPWEQDLSNENTAPVTLFSNGSDALYDYSPELLVPELDNTLSDSSSPASDRSSLANMDFRIENLVPSSMTPVVLARAYATSYSDSFSLQQSNGAAPGSLECVNGVSQRDNFGQLSFGDWPLAEADVFETLVDHDLPLGLDEKPEQQEGTVVIEVRVEPKPSDNEQTKGPKDAEGVWDEALKAAEEIYKRLGVKLLKH